MERVRACATSNGWQSMGHETAPPGAATSERFAAASPGHDHLVSFYDDDRFLVASVVAFLRPALERGDTAIVVATPEHHGAIAVELATSPALTAEAVAARLRFLDARETLDLIAPGGRLDRDRFRSVIGSVVDDAVAHQDGVRIFGEMVALQWAAGDVTGAIELESLWNELLASHRFALLCAYPSAGFDDPDLGEAFRTVCEKHGDVIPTERFSELAGDREHRRALAMLQQEVRAERVRRVQLQRQLDELGGVADRDARAADGSILGMMVAHELGSPTSVLRGVLELLRNDGARLDQATITPFLDLADANVSRIGRLAEDVLLLGRLGTGAFGYDLTELDLAVVVDQAVREVRASTGRRIELAVQDGLPKVLADGDRQIQVLHNLLGNAVKYSPAGSGVTVEVATDAAGDLVQVHVRDEGVGIAPADVDRLFQPFTRLDGARVGGPKGTGLGLYIAKALVEGQGGTISVDSVEGHGSTFSYTVPTAPSR